MAEILLGGLQAVGVVTIALAGFVAIWLLQRYVGL